MAERRTRRTTRQDDELPEQTDDELFEEADNLVETAIKRLSQIFADERKRLEGQWEKGDNVSTEDLRIALRRYRSFFDRLLTV